MKSEQPITKIKAYKIEQTKKVADAYLHAKKAGNVKVTTCQSVCHPVYSLYGAVQQHLIVYG